MGVLPLQENVRIKCMNGQTIILSMDTTTSDLSMGNEGTANVYIEMPNGQDHQFAVPLSLNIDKWFQRFSDAVAGAPGFSETLMSIRDVDEHFIIPAAPNRDNGAIERLEKKGQNARFRDFAELRSGRDQYSSKKLPDLLALMLPKEVEQAEQALKDLVEPERSLELAKMARWYLRGLPLSMALRKTQVDREISANVSVSRRGQRR